MTNMESVLINDFPDMELNRRNIVLDGWKLYSYEKVPSELEAFTKTAQEKGIDALGDVSDDRLIKEKNPLIRMIAEKQMGNHTYRIYLDYRFGSINRQILMCDEKWICVAEGNIGQLMAFAEYLNLNEKFGALEKLENGFFLGIHLMTDKCITCSQEMGKAINPFYTTKGVRPDVYLKDEDKIMDVELQC